MNLRRLIGGLHALCTCWRPTGGLSELYTFNDPLNALSATTVWQHVCVMMASTPSLSPITSPSLYWHWTSPTGLLLQDMTSLPFLHLPSPLLFSLMWILMVLVRSYRPILPALLHPYLFSLAPLCILFRFLLPYPFSSSYLPSQFPQFSTGTSLSPSPSLLKKHGRTGLLLVPPHSLPLIVAFLLCPPPPFGLTIYVCQYGHTGLLC